jgi:hypothetical protein
MSKLSDDLYNANLECESNPKSQGNPSVFHMLSVPTFSTGGKLPPYGARRFVKSIVRDEFVVSRKKFSCFER